MGRQGLREVRRHEGGAFVSGIRALIKEGSRAPSAFHHLRTQKKVKKVAICEPGSQPSPDTRSAGILTSDLPASRTVRKKAV